MKSPFKFLDSFTKDDREIFFGRDREIEELYQKVFDSKLLLVYGVSGTGKSSLIHCGLANKFGETEWLPIVIRRGGNMIESLAASIKTVSVTPQQNKFSTPVDFKKSVRSLYLDHYKPVFFIFDQFEELFIFGDKEERREFIQIIKSLIDSDIQCRLIFVMREEYMAGVTEFERYIPTFFANRVRIEKMSHLNAIEAIKEPCKVFNISLEDGFAETLLEKLSPDATDVELTYLQVFLDKIFRLAMEEKNIKNDHEQLSFTLSLLNKTGNVSDLLGSFLDEQISHMNDSGTALTILKSLVSEQGTKKQMTSGEISESCQIFGLPVDEYRLKEIIQIFISLRILRETEENEKIELRHDSLAAKIFEKFTLAEKELLEVRKYVENAYFTYEKRGLLLNKQDLDYLSGYDNRLILPPSLFDFVKMSRDKLISQNKALKKITRISTFIFILIIAIVVRFYIKTEKDSNVNEMFGSALTQSVIDPVKGVIDELNLWEKDSTSSQLLSIILRDFSRIISMQVDSSDPIFSLQESLKPLKLESDVEYAEISKEGGYIIGWTENRNVFICNLRSNEIKYFPVKEDLENIEISESKSLIALIYKNNIGTVCDFSGNKKIDFLVSTNKVMNKKLVCFFPSGSFNIATVSNNVANIYDNTGRILFELRGHKGKVNSVDVSPDGRFIVTASSDKKAYIWNFNKNINRFSIYDSLIGHNDSIWSCRFNKTGKYVITASGDSTIKIWNLNGEQINPGFNFIIDNPRFRKNNREEDEDASNPNYSKYYGKFSDASFSPGEHEIIATGYINDPDSLRKRKTVYHQVLFYSGSGGFPFAFERAYFLQSIKERKIMPVTFNEISISPDEKTASVVDNLTSSIYLLAGNFILSKYAGNYPMYSNSGDQLFWISGSEIHKTPVGIVEIKRLIERFRLEVPGKTRENNFVEI